MGGVGTMLGDEGQEQRFPAILGTTVSVRLHNIFLQIVEYLISQSKSRLVISDGNSEISANSSRLRFHL